MFGGKSTQKEVFDEIAEQFTATSGHLVTGEQCMRKWSKLLTKQKEVEDHNNKSGNDRKSWKFYNELSQCLAKDVSVKPTYTMESSSNPLDCDGIPANFFLRCKREIFILGVLGFLKKTGSFPKIPEEVQRSAKSSGDV